MVKVTANPTTGQVFTLATNKDGSPRLDKNGEKHGFIRVEQKIANLGFAYKKAVKVRSALIPMTEAAFNEAKDVFTNGSTHKGIIVRKDSLEPAYEGQKPLQYPKRNDKNEIIEGEFVTVTSGGAPVYRSEEYAENENTQDSLLSYDKQEQVATVNAAAKKETIIAG